MIAGLLAVLFSLLSGICFIGARAWTPVGLIERLFKATVEHVFFSVAGICLAVIVWSLFAPRWMERLITRVQDHVVGTLLAVIALSAISILAAFVIE